jgi:tetratricopeptide (TPR) repeat protein
VEKREVILKQCEDEIETILTSMEQSGQLNEALADYNTVEALIEAVDSSPGDPVYAQKQRILAYCLMRQANILRQLGHMKEAAALSERELTAARASGDEITLARSLMSHGTTFLAGGDIDTGLTFIEEARSLFEKGTSYDHQQGLGWYWILKADIINAKIVKGNPPDVINACERALKVLTPIENWPGVARAYGARAHAYENLENPEKAAADREAQSEYEKKEHKTSKSG